MSDQLVSLIRTVVPVAVGAALAWLASTLGIVLDETSSTALTASVVALAIAAYYTLVRLLEARWPVLGLLLGKREAPTYGLPPAETKSEYEYDTGGGISVARTVTTWPPRR